MAHPVPVFPLTTRRRAGLVAALAAGLALVACERRPAAPARGGLGRRLHAGAVRVVAPSPDGAWIAFLDDCGAAAGPFLPPGTASCTLRVVPAGGGDVQRVAAGVTTLPDGLAWADRLAALADYDYPAATGTLVEWTPGKGPRVLAEGVTFYGFGPGGELGFVAAGEVSVAPPGADPRPVPGTTGAATFELERTVPAGAGAGAITGLVRRRASSGGELLALSAAGRATLVAAGVGDYAIARGGERIAWTVPSPDGAALHVAPARLDARGPAVARGVRGFQFAPDGAALAFVAGAAPGKQGDLHVLAPDGKDALLGKEVGDFRWAARAPRLAWLERYDPRVGSGTAGAGGVDLAPRTYAGHVSDVAISADGRHLAFLQHTTRGGYSVDLGLAQLDAGGAPRFEVIAGGVFGFAFSPDGRWLYYRTHCSDGADACDLERIPASGLAPGSKPEAIAAASRSFEFAPSDPERLLVTWRSGKKGETVDLGVWDHGKIVRIDSRVLPGSARFVGPGARRVAYAVADEARRGLYVADLP